MPKAPSLDLQRRFFDPLSAGDVAGAMMIFGDNARFSFPGIPERRGRAEVQALLEMIIGRFREIRWKAEPEIYSDDGAIVSRWSVWGTYKTGKAYSNEGISFLRTDSEGKVVFFKDYFVSTDFSDT